MEPWIANPSLLALLLALLAAAASWFILPMGWARLLLHLARKAAGMKSRTISVGAIRWHFLEGGTGPALVLVHGFGATADHWLRLAQRLRRQFRVIAPDLVGFGTSDEGNELPFDIHSQAARLAELLDALGVDRCILVGSSMGGWIATAFAAANPGRAQALWLQAPLGVQSGQASPFLKAADKRGGLPALESRTDYEKHVVQAMFVRRPWIPHPLKVYYANDAVRRIAAAQRIFREVLRDSTPLEALATTVAVPVLLQWGEMDRVVDVSGEAILLQAFPTVESRLQARIGHLPMLEAPRESLRMFFEFHRRRISNQGHKP